MQGFKNYVQAIVLVMVNILLSAGDIDAQSIKSFHQIQFDNWEKSGSSLIFCPSSEMNGHFRVFFPPGLPSQGSILYAGMVRGDTLNLDWMNPSGMSGGWGLAGNSGLTAWNGTSGNFIGTSDGTDLFIATTHSNAINFWTSNESRMKLTSGGNLIIGSGQEVEKLTVGGAIALKMDTVPPVSSSHGKIFSRGSDGQPCAMDTSGMVNQLVRQFAIIEEITEPSVNGGKMTVKVWNMRKLNHLELSMGDFCTLDSANNKFSLKPGQYRVEAVTMCNQIRGFMSRIYNYTDDQAMCYGTTGSAYNASPSNNSVSMIMSVWSLTKTTAFGLEVYSVYSITQDYALGLAHTASPYKNKYSMVFIEKLN